MITLSTIGAVSAIGWVQVLMQYIILAYNLCFLHPKVKNSADSLFAYEAGKSFDTYAHCDNDYDDTLENLVNNNGDPELTALCNGDIGCILDGVELGFQAALDYVAEPAIERELKVPPVVPTASPVNGVGSEPTSSPLPPCPEDLVLYALEEDGTPFENMPLEIIAQNVTSVTLKLTAPFTDVKEYVYVEYYDQYSFQCIGYEDYEGISEATITVQCMSSHPVTIVQMFVSDDANLQGNAEIPLCCHHPDVEYPVVQYSFKVSCVRLCVDEESTEEAN